MKYFYVNVKKYMRKTLEDKQADQTLVWAVGPCTELNDSKSQHHHPDDGVWSVDTVVLLWVRAVTESVQPQADLSLYLKRKADMSRRRRNSAAV